MGLGPRMNLDSCAGCHSQPAVGGTSPSVNPQVAFASQDGGTDQVPFFITPNGPVREARFKHICTGANMVHQLDAPSSELSGDLSQEKGRQD
jgi:hypothetical protein